jgi:hypothetical protein
MLLGLLAMCLLALGIAPAALSDGRPYRFEIDRH